MRRILASLWRHVSPAPLSKEQADVLATIKYPCC
jgi:hypothetical protein